MTDLNKRLLALQRMIQEKEESLEQAEAVHEPEVPEEMDPDRCPPSLEGMSYSQIMLLAVDGDEVAEQYLSFKSVPTLNGWRMPSIKYLSRRRG